MKDAIAVFAALTLVCGSSAWAQSGAQDAVRCAAPYKLQSARSEAAALVQSGCYQNALSVLQAALQSTALVGRARALTLNDAGAVSERLGGLTDAAAFYDQALSLLNDASDAQTRLVLAINRAALQYRMGAYRQAAQSYADVLQQAERVSATPAPVLGAALGGLGLVEQTLGQYTPAREHLSRALEVDTAYRGPQHEDVATDLSNLGDVMRSAGDYDHALPTYQRALTMRKALLPAGHDSIATAMAKVAYTLENLGQTTAALELYRDVLAMRRQSLPPKHPFIAAAQSSVADALRRLGRTDEALENYLQALTLRRELLPPDHSDLADTLHNIAWLYQQQARRVQADAAFREALQIRETSLGPSHPRTAETLARWATLQAEMGHSDEALNMLARAFATTRLAGNPEVEFLAASLLARQYQAMGRTAAAIFIGKTAVNTMQALRRSSHTLDAALQRSLIRENSAIYRELAAWLVDAGRFAEAEQVLAMLKETELADLVRSADSTPTQAELNPAEAQVAAKGDALAQTAVRESAEMGLLLQRQRSGEKLSEADAARLQNLRVQQLQWQKAFEQWVGSVRTTLESAQTKGNEILGRGTQLQTLVRHDPKAVGLSYIVGEQRTVIVMATGRGSFGREVPVGRVALNRMVAALRQAIDARGDAVTPARALYGVLVAPIEADLSAAGAQTLVLGLTDSLRYVPFAALHDGRQYLVERYAITHWLQAGGTPAIAASQNWQVAGFGAAQGSARFKPLPAVPAELARIVRGPEQPDGAVPGRVFPDGAFTRAALENVLDMREFNVLHIASHFALVNGNDEQSVLLLGDGQTISLRELAIMDYSAVQLLALSACNTASDGGVNANGAEVEGLAAAVRKQGARSVLASLWPVADPSTAALMQHFYRVHQSGRANALRQAQLALLHGDLQDGPGGMQVRGVTVQGAERNAAPKPLAPAAKGWSHPYFWAPFILNGDWM